MIKISRLDRRMVLTSGIDKESIQRADELFLLLAKDPSIGWDQYVQRLGELGAGRVLNAGFGADGSGVQSISSDAGLVVHDKIEYLQDARWNRKRETELTLHEEVAFNMLHESTKDSFWGRIGKNLDLFMTYYYPCLSEKGRAEFEKLRSVYTKKWLGNGRYAKQLWKEARTDPDNHMMTHLPKGKYKKGAAHLVSMLHTKCYSINYLKGLATKEILQQQLEQLSNVAEFHSKVVQSLLHNSDITGYEYEQALQEAIKKTHITSSQKEQLRSLYMNDVFRRNDGKRHRGLTYGVLYKSLGYREMLPIKMADLIAPKVRIDNYLRGYYYRGPDRQIPAGLHTLATLGQGQIPEKFRIYEDTTEPINLAAMGFLIADLLTEIKQIPREVYQKIEARESSKENTYPTYTRDALYKDVALVLRTIALGFVRSESISASEQEVRHGLDTKAAYLGDKNEGEKTPTKLKKVAYSKYEDRELDANPDKLLADFSWQYCYYTLIPNKIEQNKINGAAYWQMLTKQMITGIDCSSMSQKDSKYIREEQKKLNQQWAMMQILIYAKCLLESECAINNSTGEREIIVGPAIRALPIDMQPIQPSIDRLYQMVNKIKTSQRKKIVLDEIRAIAQGHIPIGLLTDAYSKESDMPDKLHHMSPLHQKLQKGVLAIDQKIFRQAGYDNKEQIFADLVFIVAAIQKSLQTLRQVYTEKEKSVVNVPTQKKKGIFAVLQSLWSRETKEEKGGQDMSGYYATDDLSRILQAIPTKEVALFCEENNI